MVKLLLVPVLFVIACLFAGFYGTLHNQISYTVSSEYFTEFKFHQFGLVHFQGRVGASIVGWNASWWMGIVIGAVLIPLGLVIRGNAAYFFGMMRAFSVVCLTALTTGILGLAIASAVIDADLAGEITRYGNEIQDDVAFARAGWMHNCSYLGGLLGIISGGYYLLRQRRVGSTVPESVDQDASPPEAQK